MSEPVPPARGRLYGPLAPGFGIRIETAVRLVGGRLDAARVMDLSDDQVGKIIREMAVPNFASIAALAMKSGVNLYWIAFGQLPQLIDDASSTRKSFSRDAESAAALFDEPDVVLVRRYDLRAAAGVGAEVDSEHVAGAVPFSRRYIEGVLRAAPEDLAVLDNDGDSMTPTIDDRDLLLVDLKQRAIRNGQVFVLRLGNELVVKRVQRDVDGAVVLMSDNKTYPDRRLTQAEADQVDVIGRLVWSGGPA